ncbi:MAG: hypothetical protein QOK49_1811 [Baekduia sp.]|jgi:hypothetical protein|nr:hypothetical protein [Baekduia sp.]
MIVSTAVTVAIIAPGHPLGGDRRLKPIAPLAPAPCRCDRPLMAPDADGDRLCQKCGRARRGTS